MKKSGKFKLFSLLIFLSVALIFVGINYLESGKPPKWEWKVGIPSEPMAAQEDCNLYGNPYENEMPEGPGYITYENNNFVDVNFSTHEDEDTGEFRSYFFLKIKNTEKDISDLPGKYSIGFRDVWFKGCKSHCFLEREGPCRCWVLPNSPYPEGVGCSVEDNCAFINCNGSAYECIGGTITPIIAGSDGYSIMQQFMENYNHPCYGYDHFSLRFYLYTDIEAMNIGDSWEGEGHIWHFNIWNTSETLVDGYEKYHNIAPQTWIPLEGVEVYRSKENEWIITVNQCGFNCPPDNTCPSKYPDKLSGRYIVFWETYYQGIRGEQKGKSGKYRIKSEYREALGGATKFKFITKWTRVEQSKGGRPPK